MTSRGLAIKLAFLLHSALRHSRLQASSRHKPIARDGEARFSVTFP